MKRIAALTTLFAAGCATALALGATQASAWDIGSLPPGYSIGLLGNASAGPNECVSSYVITGYGATTTIGFGKNGRGYGGCNPAFQQQLDAFIDATYIAPVATTAPATTMIETTTATPPPSSPTPPAQTVTVTIPDPAGAAAIADLQAQIDALRAQFSHLFALVAQFPNLDPAILAALMALAP